MAATRPRCPPPTTRASTRRPWYRERGRRGPSTSARGRASPTWGRRSRTCSGYRRKGWPGRASPGRSDGDHMTTDFRDVVAAKRDRREVESDQIRSFILGYARGEVPDYLAAAFLMAAYVN